MSNLQFLTTKKALRPCRASGPKKFLGRNRKP